MKKDWLPLAVLVIILVILTFYWYNFPFTINERLNHIMAPNASNSAIPMDWTRNGTFGDSYGALNALFAVFTIAGLLYTVYLQQTQLNIQRDEMRYTRKEFQINRATDIIYRQLEKFEATVKVFEFKDNKETYIGYEAFLHLQNLIKEFGEIKEEAKESKLLKIYDEEQAMRVAHFMKRFHINHKALSEFALSVFNISAVIKDLFLSSDLKAGDLNNLHIIFIRNIGLTYSTVFDFIILGLRSQIGKRELHPNIYKDYPENKFVDFKLNAQGFSKFIKTPINQENFVRLKYDWEIDLLQ